MSKIVENEEGFPLKDGRKWECIRFGESKTPLDYSSKIRQILKFRRAMFQLWIKTQDYETKGEIELIIEALNETIKKDLDIFE